MRTFAEVNIHEPISHGECDPMTDMHDAYDNLANRFELIKGGPEARNRSLACLVIQVVFHRILGTCNQMRTCKMRKYFHLQFCQWACKLYHFTPFKT